MVESKDELHITLQCVYSAVVPQGKEGPCLQNESISKWRIFWETKKTDISVKVCSGTESVRNKDHWNNL